MGVNIVARAVAARTHWRNAHFVERLAAIIGNIEPDPENINSVVIIWVDSNLAEIQGTRVLIAHLRPMSAGIIGAKQSAFLFVLD
jgi:hypothetical protein